MKQYASVAELAQRFSSLPVRSTKKALRRVFANALEYRRNMVAEYRRLHRECRYGELLSDEFYSIEKQLMLTIRSLADNRGASLPCFTAGEYNGVCRIAALASALTTYRGGSLDLPTIVEYIEAFQTRQPLQFSELQLLPTMLKVALLKSFAALLTSGCNEFEMKKVLLSLSMIDDVSWEEQIMGLSRLVAQLSTDPTFTLLDKASRESCIRLSYIRFSYGRVPRRRFWRKGNNQRSFIFRCA